MREAIKKFLPQNFNDFFAILLVIGIIVIWILQGKNILELPEAVTGAMIVTWTLIVQFYFRRKSGGD